MALAYSYLRFSSPQQASGDSIRRQVEATTDWCRRHKAALDESLSLRDEGVSAYRGKHRENPDVHGLAAFLSAVKTGRVPAGSFLIVENLDRLTRESIVPAVNLFTGILLAGVRIVQLKPVEQMFDAGADMTAVMLALVELSRGNSESRMKSERVGAAWREKKKNAGKRVLTRMTPGWIKCEGEKLVLDPAKAATVRRIFKLAREGYGLGGICQRLNAEKVPLLGRTHFKGEPLIWSVNVVYKVLSNRAVIGEYQPHVGSRGPDRKPVGDPVRGYYPAVITEDEFHAVRGMMAARNTKGRGRRGKHVNLFAGLLRDARTGGSLTAKHGSHHSPILVPVQSRTNTNSPWVSFPLIPFERAVRELLAEVEVKDIAGTNSADDRIDALQGLIAEQEEVRAVWGAKMDNPKIADLVEAKLSEVADRLTALNAELAEARQAAANPLGEAWGKARQLARALARGDNDDDRIKYRAAVRRAVDAIHVLMLPGRGRRAAAVQVSFKSGKQRGYLILVQVAQGTGRAKEKREAKVEAHSFPEDIWPPDFDLRARAAVPKLETLLARHVETL